jgi:hypothetical protein
MNEVAGTGGRFTPCSIPILTKGREIGEKKIAERQEIIDPQEFLAYESQCIGRRYGNHPTHTDGQGFVQ